MNSFAEHVSSIKKKERTQLFAGVMGNAKTESKYVIAVGAFFRLENSVSYPMHGVCVCTTTILPDLVRLRFASILDSSIFFPLFDRIFAIHLFANV